MKKLIYNTAFSLFITGLVSAGLESYHPSRLINFIVTVSIVLPWIILVFLPPTPKSPYQKTTGSIVAWMCLSEIALFVLFSVMYTLVSNPDILWIMLIIAFWGFGLWGIFSLIQDFGRGLRRSAEYRRQDLAERIANELRKN